MNVLGWSVSIATGLAVVYGLDNDVVKIVLGEKTFTVAVSVVFAGFHRFAWALSCAWVVFACCRGYGGNFLTMSRHRV